MQPVPEHLSSNPGSDGLGRRHQRSSTDCSRAARPDRPRSLGSAEPDPWPLARSATRSRILFGMATSRLPRLSGGEVVLLVGALGVFALFLVPNLRDGAHGPADLRIFWTAARAYLHGHNPYVTPNEVGRQGDLFVYPAAMAALFAPLGWLSFTMVILLWTLTSSAAVLAALWLLDVRDVRCYAVALVSYPVV